MASPNIEQYEEEDGALIVAKGNYARVLLFGEARLAFEDLMTLTDEASVGACHTLKRYFKTYADQGPTYLSDQMFKSEGRQKVSGTKVLVHAFKGKHVRIYGVADAHKGLLCFCGTSCDPAKKQRKADPAKLKKSCRGMGKDKKWLIKSGSSHR
ncbi:hypothetical protein [Rhizobium leguminosarum]|uniref:hypothetical protein n=1 Tax=Rhizobium leguminosarum TaxID=384 RepID=UPI00140FF229|nr:hypothetical protein [Rhizobium leguminosarum]QIO58037.1 hypothetical protein HA463_10150 [Rhizobium leguminosarum bv. trifolii]